MTPRRQIIAALVSALVGFAVMLLPTGLVWNPSPDAIEYLDAARHLATGDGLVTCLKTWHLHEPGHAPAQPEPLGASRSPLLSVLLAPVVALTPHTQGAAPPRPLVQLVPALAAALAAAAALILAARLGAPPSAAWLAGLAVALLPALGGAARHLWAEPLAAASSLGALACLAGASGSARRAGAAGFLAGLAALTRPEGLIVLPVILLAATLQEPRRWGQPAGLLAGWLAAQLPWWLWNGSCLPPQSFLFSVHSFHELTWLGYREPPIADTNLFLSDPGFAIRGALWNLWLNLRACLSPRHAGLVLPLTVVAMLPGPPAADTTPERRPWQRLWPCLLLSALWLVAVSAAASTRDPRRFTCVPLVLITPAAAWGLTRLPGMICHGLKQRFGGTGAPRRCRALAVGILALHLGAAGGRIVGWNLEAVSRSRTGRWVSAKPGDAWSHPDLERVLHLAGELPDTTRPHVLAATFPWALSMRTTQPCILLPTSLRDDLLFRFIDEFTITTLVLDTAAPERGHADLLEPLHYEQSLAHAGRLAAVRNAGRYRVLTLQPGPP